MKVFTNKEEFADRPEIYDILTRLEKAHKEQDELAAAILLTKLKQKNIKLIVDKKEEN